MARWTGLSVRMRRFHAEFSPLPYPRFGLERSQAVRQSPASNASAAAPSKKPNENELIDAVLGSRTMARSRAATPPRASSALPSAITAVANEAHDDIPLAAAAMRRSSKLVLQRHPTVLAIALIPLSACAEQPHAEASPPSSSNAAPSTCANALQLNRGSQRHCGHAVCQRDYCMCYNRCSLKP